MRIQQTSYQIDSVRSTILLRQTLLKWKSEHDRVLALPGTADAHRRSYLLSTTFDLWATKLKKRDNARRLAAYLARKKIDTLERSWTKWRQDLVQRRTTRWERDMKRREKAFVKASSSRKLADTFDVSTRPDTSERFADILHSNGTTLPGLAWMVPLRTTTTSPLRCPSTCRYGRRRPSAALPSTLCSKRASRTCSEGSLTNGEEGLL